MKNKAVNNIIITGATRGLGLSHAQYLAKRGYNIALLDISKDACSIYGEVQSISTILEKLRKSKFTETKKDEEKQKSQEYYKKIITLND